MSDHSWSRRDFLKRSALVAGGAVVAPSLITACSKSGGGSSLDDLKDKGTITIGISGEEPYSFRKDGKLTGEAPTVQEAIWHAIGIKNVESKQTEFSGLIPGLNSGHFDVVAAGMAITADRCKKAEFSEPVYCASEALMVKKGNPKNLSDFKSLASSGATLGVFSGAIEGDFAKDAGVSAGKIKTIPNQQAGMLQLTQGRIDAIALTRPSLAWALKQSKYTDQLEVLKGVPPTSCGGAVFRTGSDDLRDAFNEQLKKLKDSGKLMELIKPFGFTEDNKVPEGTTTEKLCKGNG